MGVIVEEEEPEEEAWERETYGYGYEYGYGCEEWEDVEEEGGEGETRWLMGLEGGMERMGVVVGIEPAEKGDERGTKLEEREGGEEVAV